VTAILAELLDALEGSSAALVSSVKPSEGGEKQHDVDALGHQLSERQRILDELQKADTSRLNPAERASAATRITEVLRQDDIGLKLIRKHMKSMEESSSILAQARRAVTGYRPVPSDAARPLRSIV
jgi:hypothetical protein